MKKRTFILYFICLVLYSCISNKFVKELNKPENKNEIKAFKMYLESINFMEDFKGYILVHSASINDSIIDAFIIKYNIRSIEVIPCSNWTNSEKIFNNCGNIIKLRESRVPLVDNFKVLVFDYSEEELKLKSKYSKKHKIMQGVFIY